VEVRIGEGGEILTRSGSTFAGYWNNAEASRAALADGWLHTGDLGRLDDKGNLWITGRCKDMIIRGGENIGCGHVEAALLMHPEVREASVYAVPDDRMGEEVGATIYAGDALDLDQLRAFLAQHLARYEVPRYLLRASGPLPRTPSGKILRRQIRDEALARLALPSAP
jgi:long-chain acyl-CoA synthetase